MAKKAKVTGKMSSGNKASMNKAKEERRQAKFAKKRDEGRAYEYKPNPYDKNSKDYSEWSNYYDLAEYRSYKNVDRKTPVARLTSIMKKLDNQLAKERMERKTNKEKFARNRNPMNA